MCCLAELCRKKFKDLRDRFVRNLKKSKPAKFRSHFKNLMFLLEIHPELQAKAELVPANTSIFLEILNWPNDFVGVPTLPVTRTMQAIAVIPAQLTIIVGPMAILISSVFHRLPHHPNQITAFEYQHLTSLP